MKIRRGPTIEKYASIYVQQLDFDIDEACDEVIEWVNFYINNPGEHREATEEARRDSIFEYIKSQIAASTYGRIKESLEKECLTTTDAPIVE
jgi:hypothetical protein